MQDHEIQSNVHSLELFLCFPNNLKTALSFLVVTDICRVMDKILMHCADLVRGFGYCWRKNVFDCCICNPSTTLNTHTLTCTHSSCCGDDISRRTSSMTDGKSPLSPTVTNRFTGDSWQGHVCVCTGVKLYLSFVFHYNKLNSISRTYLDKVRRCPLSHVNMLSALSSRWRIDEHLSHRLLK